MVLLAAFTFFLLCLAPVLPSNAAEVTTPENSDVKLLIKKTDKMVREGKFDQAEKLLRAASVDHPNNSLVTLKLAFACLKLRLLTDAYNLSFGVAKAEPKNAYAFAVLGSTLLAGGQFVEAKKILANAIALNKKEGLAWASYGMLEFYENRIYESLDFLREAVFWDPENPDYLFAFAQVSARSERYKEAAEHYHRFLAISRNTDDDRRARIRGLIDFLTFLGNRSSLYAVSGAEFSSVPVELLGNRPIILMKVNGRPEPLRFVLDTGSGISVISDETAKRLRIRPVARGGSARGIGGDGKFDIVYGFLREVELGSTKIKHVPVYVRKFHSNMHDIDGYIGISLISKFRTTIDYGNQTFTLDRKELGPSAEIEPGSITLPLRLTSSGFLSGEVKLEGLEKHMNFIVDTGASVSVISEDLARLEPISSFVRTETMRVVGSAGVTENVRSFMLPKISFGDHSRKSIMAIALDLDLINEASGFEQAGILGGNFLKNYRMTFDFKNSRLMFTPLNKDN